MDGYRYEPFFEEPFYLDAFWSSFSILNYVSDINIFQYSIF